MAVCCLVVASTGCRLFNPTSGGPYDDTSDNGTPSSVINLSVPVSIPAASQAAGSIRAQAENATASFVIGPDGRRLVTGATVTYTNFEGDIASLTEDPDRPGYYIKRNVSRQDIERGFVLRAIRGLLELKNVVTKEEIGTSEELVARADELTTAFSDLALQAAGETSIERLIQRYEELELELEELRKQIEDPRDETFKAVREKYETVTGGVTNEDLEEPEDSEEVVETVFQRVRTEIEQVIATLVSQVPVRSAEEIRNRRARRFVSVVIGAHQQNGLSDGDKDFIRNHLSNDFMLNGMTKEMLMQEHNISSSLRASTANGDDVAVLRFDMDELQVEELSDDTYLYSAKGTVVMTDGTSFKLDGMEQGFTFDENFDVFTKKNLGSELPFPFMIQKDDEEQWKVIGNKIKLEHVKLELIKKHLADRSSTKNRTALWMQADEAELSIESIEVTGTRLDSTVELESSQWDEEYWYYFADRDIGDYSHEYPLTSVYPTAGWRNQTHSAGDKYEFLVTYEDGTTQTFVFTVKSHNDIDYLENVDIEVSDNLKNITIKWPESRISDFECYMIAIESVRTADGFVNTYEEEITDKKVRSFTFNKADQYDLFRIIVSVNTHRGITARYVETIEVKDPTIEEMVLDMVAPLSDAFSGLAETGETISELADAAYAIATAAHSILPSDLDGIDLSNGPFPAGTIYYDDFDYTQFPEYFGLTQATDTTKLFKLNVSAYPTGRPSMLLMEFWDDVGEELVGYASDTILETNPTHFGLLAIVEYDFEGNDVLLWLQNEEIPIDTEPENVEFDLIKGRVITNAFGGEVEIRFPAPDPEEGTSSNYDVSDDEGNIFEGLLFKNNGEPFKSTDIPGYQGDSVDVTMCSIRFDKIGLIRCNIHIGDTSYHVERVDGVLVIKEP